MVILLLLNFISGEKKIHREVTHQYNVADPQCGREMGLLLGPPLLEGNRIETLLNGDQILPLAH